MSAVAVTCPPRPGNPALFLVLLAVTALGCAAGAVALIVAAPGAALLTAAVLVLAGWLVHLAAAVPLGWLLTGAVGAVLVAVWPWLLLVAVLACLALPRGGSR